MGMDRAAKRRQTSTIVVLGARGAGKQSLIRRCRSFASAASRCTLCDVSSDYETTKHLSSATAILFVVDATRLGESLEFVNRCAATVHRRAPDGAQRFLVVTKCDAIDWQSADVETRSIWANAQIDRFMDRNRVETFHTTSAVTGAGVDALFASAVATATALTTNPHDDAVAATTCWRVWTRWFAGPEH